jgi:hypothetical protein
MMVPTLLANTMDRIFEAADCMSDMAVLTLISNSWF